MVINKTLYSFFLALIIGYFIPINGQPVLPSNTAGQIVNQQLANSPIDSNLPESRWDKVPEDIRNKNSFKRFEWFYRTRENNEGVFPKNFIQQQKMEEISKIKTFVQEGYSIQTTSDMWSNIGPKAIDMSSSFIPHWGKVSGRVRGVAVHPTDPNTVYIGAAAGGIWKTVDGGANWTDMSGDLNLLTFGAIAIDPNNTNIVYAGSGESMASFNTVTFEGDGMYKSTDGGISWTKLTAIGTQTQFADIEVSPHNSNIILAALGSGNWNNGSPTNEGVWRSIDAGATWVRVINQSDAFDVGFDPTPSSTKAYAATGDQNPSGGFFISTNSGSTWTQSNTGLPTPSTIRRIQFSVSPSNPDIIFSVINNNSLFPSGHTTVAFKSINAGVNWSQISAGVNIAGSYNGTAVSDQGSYDLCLDVSPTNANNVYFGNVELSRTTDGSTISFVRKSPPTFTDPGAWDAPMHVDIHKIVYAPSNSNIIYVGCDGGIYKSVDGGTNWTHINNNINTIQFYNIASDPNNENIIFGGAQDNGNFSTADKGATDWEFETSGDGMVCFVDYNNSNNVFMSTQNGNLMRSIDAGITWVGMVGSDNTNAWVAPFWQHPINSAYLYAGWQDRIIRSPNSGANWYYHSSNITSNALTSVAHSAVDTNKLMAVASYFDSTPDVYISTDEASTWVTITGNLAASGFSPKSIQKAVADPLDENTFYLCRVSYTTGQVLKTTDFGTTWTDISGNLPKIAHNDLFIDPANSNHLYVANDFGVYWTSNGGTDWHKLSNGMPFVPVLDFDFYVNGSTRLLRAATHGRGIFEMQIDTPLQKIYVDLKIFLEGPFSGTDMSIAIAESVPNQQPYNTAPWNYAGTETASIASTSDIVDWVLIELRTGASPSAATTVVDTKAALLKSDGTIVDADGITNLNFDVAAGDYYIVIYHRNHLPVMSPAEITIN